MGHGASKYSIGGTGAEEFSDKVHCKLDATMTNTLVIPDGIAKKYCLQCEIYIGLLDSKNDVYCCGVQEIDGKTHLTKGWREFLNSTGAVVGDCMVFNIKGPDETVVLLFRCDGKDIVCGSSMCVVNATSDTIPTIGTGPGSEGGDTDEGDDGTWEDMSNVLAAWREKFYIGKDVDLEDWMVEYIGSSLDWEMPDTEIYVGKVEATSVANNRMRLPRVYTTESVVPLLKSKNESFFLQGGLEEDTILKFSVGKDGRAVFTVGWTDFANANGVRAGSIVSFIFRKINGEVRVDVDVLKK